MEIIPILLIALICMALLVGYPVAFTLAGTSILFALLGEFIFSFYNITIHSFRIAGGLLLFKISLDMLESKRSRTKTTPKEEKEAEEKDAIAFTPLSIPLIAGPGSIATIMILASESNSNNDNFAIFFALTLVLLITLLIFRISDIISK